MRMIPRAKIVLLGTGGYFSCQVLYHLASLNLTPMALVLPQYPPAKLPNADLLAIDQGARLTGFVNASKEYAIPLLYAPQENQTELCQRLKSYDVDYILVACWPYLLSRSVRSQAAKAALNLHPSLLPDYRGADPISDQLTSHETRLGVSLHLLNDRFDRGGIISQGCIETGSGNADRQQIEYESAKLGGQLFSDAVNSFSDPGWQPRKQK